MPAAQSPNWMFTLNNPRPTDDPTKWPDFRYLVYQGEKGENGTNHYQGYVIFKKRMTLTAVRKACPRCHWEIRKGTHQQAIDYCTKAESRVSDPIYSGSYDPDKSKGSRTDLDEVKKAIDDGSSMLNIAECFFGDFLKYERGFRSYMKLKAKPRSWKSCVRVFWGPTGTGKTMKCNELSPDAFWYCQQKDGKWWDYYDGVADVVLDEFYGGIMWSQLLVLLDRYPCTVETKGGVINFAPRNIYITSNMAPDEWYSASNRRDYATLSRRLDFIYWVPEFNNYVLQKLPAPAEGMDPLNINTVQEANEDPFDASTDDEEVQTQEDPEGSYE